MVGTTSWVQVRTLPLFCAPDSIYPFRSDLLQGFRYNDSSRKVGSNRVVAAMGNPSRLAHKKEPENAENGYCRILKITQVQQSKSNWPMIKRFQVYFPINSMMWRVLLSVFEILRPIDQQHLSSWIYQTPNSMLPKQQQLQFIKLLRGYAKPLSCNTQSLKILHFQRGRAAWQRDRYQMTLPYPCDVFLYLPNVVGAYWREYIKREQQ